MILEIKRDNWNETTTLGKLYIDDVYFCETLEDREREFDVKIKGETAIPFDLEMKVKIHLSNHFKREVLLLYTEDDEVTISNGEVTFSYVYLHGGNTYKDTLGCPLVAYLRINDNTIQGSAEKDLFDIVSKRIKLGEEVKIKITSK